MWWSSLLSRLRDLIEWLLLPTATQARPPATCPISWQPSVAAPVRYGYRDYYPQENPVFTRLVGGTREIPPLEFGPPTPIRVFFPTLNPAPQEASILEGCGRYPLIVFAHGHCQSDDRDVQFQRWTELCSTLARSGFVVVSPRLPSTGGGSHASVNDGEVELIDRLVTWMRGEWAHKTSLSEDTGVVGHSYGGLLLGRYAVEGTATVSAFASLGSAWTEWAPGVFPSDSPLPDLGMPRLFGVGGTDSDAAIAFNSLEGTRHLAIFAGAGHWDFLPQDRSPCNRFPGECGETWGLTNDSAALFFGKYLPLEFWPNLGEAIANSLTRAPKRRLSLMQWFLSLGNLASLGLLKSNVDGCGVTARWVTPTGEGSVTRP
jgi:hypothetical protein